LDRDEALPIAFWLSERASASIMEVKELRLVDGSMKSYSIA